MTLSVGMGLASTDARAGPVEAMTVFADVAAASVNAAPASADAAAGAADV